MMPTLEQIAYLVGIFGGAAAAVWAVFSRLILPAQLERQRLQLESDLDDRKDRREYGQKQNQLEQSYHLSEQAVVQQLMVELVANAQESEQKAYAAIREDAKTQWQEAARTLAIILEDVHTIKEAGHKRGEVINKILYEQKNLASQIRTITTIILDDANKPRTVDNRSTRDLSEVAS